MVACVRLWSLENEVEDVAIRGMHNPNRSVCSKVVQDQIRSRLSILEVGKQSISQRLQVDSESIDRFDINLLFDGFVLAIEEHPTLVGFSD